MAFPPAVNSQITDAVSDSKDTKRSKQVRRFGTNDDKGGSGSKAKAKAASARSKKRG